MSYEVYGDNDDSPSDAASEAGWLNPDDLSRALIDVMNERDRQWKEEGFLSGCDDLHADGEMARAAAVYANYAMTDVRHEAALAFRAQESCPDDWPWESAWWKPTTRRRDLVKAAALLLAEIERLDRAAGPK